MERLKILFQQTLMISTAMLFGLGVQAAIAYFAEGEKIISWPWYIPLSVILCGFLCAVPTNLLLSARNDDLSVFRLRLYKILHFVLIWGIVAFCGFLFRWYGDFGGLAFISVDYVIIYVFVWVATLWIMKSDEHKINEAIKEIQDEE